MNIEVTIDATRIERALQLPGGLGGRILRRRARRVENRAKQLAPGSMPDQITSRVTGSGAGLVGEVISGHPASVYVIYGTRPHVIRPRRAKALRFTAGGRLVFAAKVNHPGNAANDFLGQALREAL